MGFYDVIVAENPNPFVVAIGTALIIVLLIFLFYCCPDFNSPNYLYEGKWYDSADSQKHTFSANNGKFIIDNGKKVIDLTVGEAATKILYRGNTPVGFWFEKERVAGLF
jgi:hypothetical protein